MPKGDKQLHHCNPLKILPLEMEHEQRKAEKRNTTKKSNTKIKNIKKFSLFPPPPPSSISFPNSPSPTPFPSAQPTGKCRPIPEMGSLVRSPTTLLCTPPPTFEVWEEFISWFIFRLGLRSRVSAECAVRAPGSVLEEFACLMSGNGGALAGNVRDGGGQKQARTWGMGMCERDSENRLVCWSDWV